MSSPLDSRMRAIARTEVEALLDSIKSPNTEMAADGAPVSASVANGLTPTQQQIADLHEHLHHAVTTIGKLEERVEALEKVAKQTDQAARRVTRKTGGA